MSNEKKTWTDRVIFKLECCVEVHKPSPQNECEEITRRVTERRAKLVRMLEWAKAR